jgi:hypothetical protein
LTYRASDLGLFTLLRDPTLREGTAYFEFHPAELPEPFACWLEGSIFMRDAAFDFFAECFHSATSGFDYFSFQRFDQGDISRLLLELDTFLSTIESKIPTREVLFAKYASLFTKDIWSELDTSILAPAVAVAGRELRGYIAERTKDSKCLWVLGM